MLLAEITLPDNLIMNCSNNYRFNRRSLEAPIQFIMAFTLTNGPALMSNTITKAEVFDIVKNNILDILPKVQPEMVSIEKSLSDLGANSVDRMEVVTMSMEDLGVKIPLMSFAGVTNIEGLVDVLFNNAQ
jgi:polyketide biosynthesis acyl carrier protein